MRKLMASLVLATLAVACNDPAAAPEQQQTPAVSADFMNNPDGGGAVVERYQFDNWNTVWNNLPANTVRAYHTTFPLSWALGAAWNDAVCGPTNPTPGMHLQEVAHWDHNDPTSVWIQNGVADVWIVLVDRTRAGPCNTRPIIASGWGRLHYTDNNATGTLARTQDAWTFRAQGSLMTPAGARVQYNGLLHCVFTKNAAFDPLTSCNYKINY